MSSIINSKDRHVNYTSNNAPGIALCLILVFSLAITSSVQAQQTGQTNQLPSWYLNTPASDDYFILVSGGSTAAEALCHALINLASQVELIVSFVEDVRNGERNLRPESSDTRTSLRFGNIDIESQQRMEDSDVMLFRMTGNVRYNGAAGSYEFDQILQEIDDLSDSRHTQYLNRFTVREDNVTFQDMVRYLRDKGVEVTFAYADTESFAKIRVPTELVMD